MDNDSKFSLSLEKSDAIKIICDAFDKNNISNAIGLVALIDLTASTAVDSRLSKNQLIDKISSAYEKMKEINNG